MPEKRKVPQPTAIREAIAADFEKQKKIER
jgi:hypothetical protein